MYQLVRGERGEYAKSRGYGTKDELCVHRVWCVRDVCTGLCDYNY